MRKIILLLLMASVLASCGSEEILIGVMDQQGIREPLEMLVEDVNSAGGLEGKSVRLVYQEKDAFSASDYRQMREEGAKYIITALENPEEISLLANEDGIIQVEVSSLSAGYASPGDYTFRTSPSEADLAGKMARQMNSMSLEAIGVIYVQTDEGLAAKKSFEEALDEVIVSVDVFKPDETDYTLDLVKMAKAGAENIFLIGNSHHVAGIVRQAEKFNENFSFYTYSVIERRDFLELAGSSAEGLVYTAPEFDTDNGNPVASRFIQEYEERYGGAPSLQEAQAYDGLLVVLNSLEQCNYIMTSCVKDELSRMEIQGASGRIAFDENGDVKKEAVLKMVKDGKFVKFS